MSAQFFIITFLVLVSITAVLVFYSESEKLKKQHLEKKTGLITQLAICGKQIVKRNNGLNCYDFLKYNLSEALIIQSEIKIL